VINPATGATLGDVPNMGRQEAHAAVAAAQVAFSDWSGRPAQTRAQILGRLASLIRENASDLARLITLEQGKPLAEAEAEMGASAAYIQWFAEEARRVYGDVIPAPASDRRILVMKQPVGVVGCITPWNFPSLIVARKLGPALATGCTVVLKPSELTPFSALALGRLCQQAGVPDGVVNILTGSPAPIGDELVENPAVRKISFTGSTATGRMLAARAGQTLKRVSLELGGNAPFIVFNDADLDKAVESAVLSKFRNAGQTCVCTNRFYVQSGVYRRFVERFVAKVSSLRLGDGLDPQTTLGPLINAASVQKVREHIDDAIGKGGTLLLGTAAPEGETCFVAPVVIGDATADMRLASEETFGPVAPIFRFESIDEIEELANSSGAGLVAYVFTESMTRVFRLTRTLEYGQIGVNEGLITTEVAPFGGLKDSGMGREGSKYGCDDYLDLKYTCIGNL
jgi:succinate-semialdehyde dehydrogenase/glutarate-semialdehyde dehydrogenase